MFGACTCFKMVYFYNSKNAHSHSVLEEAFLKAAYGILSPFKNTYNRQEMKAIALKFLSCIVQLPSVVDTFPDLHRLKTLLNDLLS